MTIEITQKMIDDCAWPLCVAINNETGKECDFSDQFTLL